MWNDGAGQFETVRKVPLSLRERVGVRGAWEGTGHWETKPVGEPLFQR